MGGIRFAVIIYFLYTLFVELIQGELETNSVQPEAKTGSKSYPFLIGTAPNEQTIRKKAPPDAEDLATRAGYTLKSYETQTDDGYNLVIHRLLPLSGFRMPRGSASKKPVVLLQHGIAQSSSEWLINESGKSLAMMLVDNGYDVWLGNSRGNKYSNSHRTLKENTMDFYNFTFHEMGVFDFPATVDLVLRETQQSQINYIGCSIGATVAFVALSEHPEYAQKIKFMAALSPLAFLAHTRSPIKILAPHLPEIKTAWEKLRVMRINPETLPKMINSQLGTLCFWGRLSGRLCNSIYKMLDEFGFRRIEEKHLETLWKFVPTTTSARTCIHLLQLMNNPSEQFDEFDYGSRSNAQKYGTLSPPEYELRNVQIPVGIFSGREESLNTFEDTEVLKRSLPNVVFHIELDSNFKVHTDFTHEANAVDQIFTPVIAALDSYNKK